MIRIIGNIPRLITTLSIFVLLVAVVHDWGYFLVVGSKFQELQTPYDYIANSIEWLPFGLLFLCFYGVIPALIANVVPQLIKGPFVEGFEDVVRVRFRRRRIILGVCGAAIIVALVAVVFWCRLFYELPEWEVYPPMLFLAAGFVGISIAYFGKSLGGKLQGQIALFLFFGLVACALAFYGGVLSAGYDLFTSASNIYRVELKSGPTVVKKILRTSEKGLLEYDPRGRATNFVRWEEVKSVTHLLGEEDQSTNPACDAIGLNYFGTGAFSSATREEFLRRYCVPPAFLEPDKAGTNLGD
jgi:hypothetical protein